MPEQTALTTGRGVTDVGLTSSGLGSRQTSTSAEAGTQARMQETCTARLRPGGVRAACGEKAVSRGEGRTFPSHPGLPDGRAASVLQPGAHRVTNVPSVVLSFSHVTDTNHRRLHAQVLCPLRLEGFQVLPEHGPEIREEAGLPANESVSHASADALLSALPGRCRRRGAHPGPHPTWLVRRALSAPSRTGGATQAAGAPGGPGRTCTGSRCPRESRTAGGRRDADSAVAPPCCGQE